MTLKLGSLFDGSGGWPLSATIAGVEPVWASEIEPFPIEVTRKRFPNMKHLGDITKIHGDEIEPVDIISSGSPCVDLSVAGKRAGLQAERSGLFMDSVRIVKEMRGATNGVYPRVFIWENVMGAFSSNKGEDFRTVIEEVAKVADESVSIPKPDKGKWMHAGFVEGRGYSVAWRVLDAQYWGVPQRRSRIFLVGCFGDGLCAGKILFERKGLLGDFKEIIKTWEDTSTDIDERIAVAGKRYRGEVRGTEADGRVEAVKRDAQGLDTYNQALTGSVSMPLRSSQGGDNKAVAIVGEDCEKN